MNPLYQVSPVGMCPEGQRGDCRNPQTRPNGEIARVKREGIYCLPHETAQRNSSMLETVFQARADSATSQAPSGQAAQQEAAQEEAAQKKPNEPPQQQAAHKANEQQRTIKLQYKTAGESSAKPQTGAKETVKLQPKKNFL